MSKKKRLAEYIIEDIRNMLKAGVYQVGDKLPNQTEFAKQLGVSRLSLREALQTLETMGIVEQRPKIGTVIKRVEFDKRDAGRGSQGTQKEADKREMAEARASLESTVSIEALQSMSEEQLEALEYIFREIHRRLNDTGAENDEAKLRAAVNQHAGYIAQWIELLFKKSPLMNSKAGERYYP